MKESAVEKNRSMHDLVEGPAGYLERGWVIASETAALDIVGASFVREIQPGELVAVDVVAAGHRLRLRAGACPPGPTSGGRSAA